MFPGYWRLRRYFLSKRYKALVQVKVGLQIEEYPRGFFRIFYKTPGDTSLTIDSFDGEVRACYRTCCELCREKFLTEVRWQKVTIDVWGDCHAPSIERLEEALSHVTFSVDRLGDR